VRGGERRVTIAKKEFKIKRVGLYSDSGAGEKAKRVRDSPNNEAKKRKANEGGEGGARGRAGGVNGSMQKNHGEKFFQDSMQKGPKHGSYGGKKRKLK